MAKKQTKQTAKKNDDRKTFAFIATFFGIVGFIITIATKRKDKYVMFYAKQSLTIFIFAIIGAIISSIIGIIPIFGWIVSEAIRLLILILWVFSWANALSDKEKETPVIGQYAKNFNF